MYSQVIITLQGLFCDFDQYIIYIISEINTE